MYINIHNIDKPLPPLEYNMNQRAGQYAHIYTRELIIAQELFFPKTLYIWLCLAENIGL